MADDFRGDVRNCDAIGFGFSTQSCSLGCCSWCGLAGGLLLGGGFQWDSHRNGRSFGRAGAGCLHQRLLGSGGFGRDFLGCGCFRLRFLRRDLGSSRSHGGYIRSWNRYRSGIDFLLCSLQLFASRLTRCLRFGGPHSGLDGTFRSKHWRLGCG